MYSHLDAYSDFGEGSKEPAKKEATKQDQKWVREKRITCHVSLKSGYDTNRHGNANLNEWTTSWWWSWSLLCLCLCQSLTHIHCLLENEGNQNLWQWSLCFLESLYEVSHGSSRAELFFDVGGKYFVVVDDDGDAAADRSSSQEKKKGQKGVRCMFIFMGIKRRQSVIHAPSTAQGRKRIAGKMKRNEEKREATEMTIT